MKTKSPIIFTALAAFTIAASAAAYAQDIKPTPTPPPSDDDVVKISTNLIQIDVSVTDAKGRAITDLKQEDFEIFENGQKQPVSNFSFVSAPTSLASKPAVLPKDAVPVPQATLRPEQVRRTVALVVDDLSLSFESTAHVKQALKKFVDEQMQEGDLVAIVRTGAGIGALQQFTSDKKQLYAAIDRVKWNPFGKGGIGAFAPIESPSAAGSEPETDATGDDTPEPAQAPVDNFNEFRGSYFATGTLGAMRYIITGMSELPGRKSVLLFSDGFKLMEKDEEGFSDGGIVLDFLRQLIDQANRSSVVVYTIDPRGLQTAGFTAQDAPSDTSPDAMNAALSARRDELLDTQEGLTYLAAETGGFAVINNNDIPGGVKRVIEDQSYYLIGYEPDTDTFDPQKRRFNHLTVKVARKDAQVRYRSGFFNVAEKETPSSVPASQTPAQQIQTALTSPFAARGISLHLSALFSNDPKLGTSVRSLLHVDAADLKFTDQPDGTKKAAFDVLAMSFGDNGQPVEQLSKSYGITIKPENYKRFVENGFVYSFVFPVKKPGPYQFRVALRDQIGGKVGSASQFIDVPNLKKQRLTLSSLVIENISGEQWKARVDGSVTAGDPLGDTAVRRIRVGSILRYGFEIYNAHAAGGGVPANVTTRLRVFKDGKLVLDGRENPVQTEPPSDPRRIRASGAIRLGSKMDTGDYILQVVVTDKLAKENQRIATQYVQFELVE